MIKLLILGAAILLVIVILGTLLLIPGMDIFNKMTDKKYNDDEKDLLTGTLTTAISSLSATGEVMTTFAVGSRKSMPARIFTPNQAGVERLEKGAAVLIVETKDAWLTLFHIRSCSFNCQG